MGNKTILEVIKANKGVIIKTGLLLTLGVGAVLGLKTLMNNDDFGMVTLPESEIDEQENVIDVDVIEESTEE